MGNFQYYKYSIWHYGPSTLIKLWQCLMEGGPAQTLADSVYYKLKFKYNYYHKNSYCKAIKFCQP